MRRLRDILKDAISCLDEMGIEYVVVGGFAVMYHGRPRATADLDVVAVLDTEKSEKLAIGLKERGFFADVDDIKTAMKEKSHCTIEDEETLFRLDIKGVYDSADRRALARKMLIEWGGIRMYISSAEDTILNKLSWGREQDIEDALSIIIRRKNLHQKYLKETARKIGVLDKLEALEKLAH